MGPKIRAIKLGKETIKYCQGKNEDQLLGKTNNNKVYLGKTTQDKRLVAVKVPQPNNKSLNNYKRLENVIRTLKEHRNIHVTLRSCIISKR